jgi:hypothetical protein
VRSRTRQVIVALSIAGCSASPALCAFATDSGEVRGRAEHSFGQLKKQTEGKDSPMPGDPTTRSIDDRNSYSPDQYLIGRGQGDMAKGPIVCQRVSELSARTDLAKQIRVLVKEHMIDRLRERTGRDPEQDIEVTREEIVREYLQGVTIVDRLIDENTKTCSATAVMHKSRIQSKPAPDHLEPVPMVAQ